MGAFVGRGRERALLAERVRAARQGAGGVVLVGGEPGVGKTRLAEEAAKAAAALGMCCAQGRAVDDDGCPPLYAVNQILRAIGAEGGIDPAGDERDERLRRNENLVEIMARAGAERGGLFVVLDDVQWADPGSLRLLVHLARNVGREAVCVVATYRDTEPVPALRDALAALARESAVDRIRLEGLAADEVAAQLDAVAGFAVPEAVAAAVHRRTRGNPFFVGELGAQLARREMTDAGALPAGIRDAVRARLARLTPGTRAVVAVAAVVGAGETALLATVAQVSSAAVIAAVDEARAAGILDAGQFTHDLIREAAAAEVPTAERLAMHAAAAEALRGSGDVPRVAHHLLESLPLGDAAAAAEWARRAGDLAAGQLAWEEAADWYGRALAAEPGARRAEILIARAQAQKRGYDIEGARASLLAAAAIARERGDGAAIARAVLVMEGVSDFLWDPTGRALAEEALAALPDDDSGLRARLLAGSVVMEMWRVPPDADARSRAALGMAERAGDRHAVVEALRARQFACAGPAGAEERLALGTRLLGMRRGDDDAAMWGRLWRFDAYAQLGDLTAVARESSALTAMAERMRSPLARWHAIRTRATLAAARGRFAEAIELGEAAIALSRRSGHDGSTLPSFGYLLAVRAMVGDFTDRPEETILRHIDESATVGLRGMLAKWMFAAGRLDEAEEWYRGLPGVTELPDFVRLPAASGLIEMAAAFGDTAMVERMYGELLPHAARFVCGGAGVIIIEGPVRLPLGIGAAALGRLDEAEEHLRAAIDLAERAGMPPAAATARYHLARTVKNPELSEKYALQAAAQAAELGMRPLQTAAHALAGGPLTKREREIAAHVAQGKTSRSIAQELHLSERTVETHVQHILTKLGLANRTQLATWHARSRTPDT
ncbi:AAA family ATPase [Dactylosporangium sp. CS-033363]|uniref:AAA family ATPase n=1 Tax=Dactylosporangium sp. CS-033363 TaxID=3239935 RepID=UPI003D90157E